MKFLRGWLGEAKTSFTLWVFLDKTAYWRTNNVILPAKNGTAQIDHVVVSPYGIFIVETKNLTGWIFGAADHPKWTQVFFKKKYRFQNPLRQAFRQKRSLAEYLEINENCIHTIIYFTGDCSFKTLLPPNVIKSGLVSCIKAHNDVVFTSSEVDKIVTLIQRLSCDPSLTKTAHLTSLHQRLNSTTVCPKCGAKLVERIAKKGSQSGSKFLGCDNYPKCRFTRNI